MEESIPLPSERSESASTLIEPNSSVMKNGDDLTPEQLWDKLSVAEAKAQKYEDKNIELRAQLAVYKDQEKEQKKQLESLSALIISNGSHQKSVDLQQMYDQLLYKDKRIVELNNIIVEKEAKIMDLQEMCREQGEVAAAKKQAVQIVNRRLQELDARNTKDASTETDIVFSERRGSKKRVNSPGRAVPQLRLSSGNGSPPPLDPAEDHSSFTTETATYDDPDREWSPSPSASAALNRISRKYRKKVTFDLKPSGKKDKQIKREVPSPDPSKAAMQGIDAEIAQQIIDLTNENDELRRIIAEIERAPLPEQQLKIEQLEEELENTRRNGKNQVLRARATAQARIKELEGRIMEVQTNQARDVESLNATNEALKASRDFIVDENAKLLELVKKQQEKEARLLSELEGGVELSLKYRRELDEELRRMHDLRHELKEANRNIQVANDEKQVAFNEVENLKEALFAQDELIKVLEGDLIVYEAHVGLLRESLGASKVEDLENIRSKAINAKINALETEKQDIMKKRNDEKLIIKSLRVKIKCLEDERSELLQRIQKHENHEFPPQSLEDLRRFDANQPQGSSVYSASVSPGVIAESKVQPSAPTLDDYYSHELNELRQQLDTIVAEKEKLESELASIKASRDGGQSILGLLHAIEDIAMAPVFDDRQELTGAEDIDVNAENFKRLENENEHLKRKNSHLYDNLQHFQVKVEELEAVAQDANQVQNLLESQKASIYKEVEKLKEELAKKEEELLAAQSKGQLSGIQETKWKAEVDALKQENATLAAVKVELEHKAQSLQRKLEDIMAEKTLLENKIAGLQRQNIGLAESNERMSRFEAENNRLDTLVANLKTQVEQFQVEAELSRTCLDDMRRMVARATNNQSTAGVQRIPSIDETMAMKTALEALNSSLPPQKIDQGAYQSTPPPSASSATTFYPTDQEQELAEEGHSHQPLAYQGVDNDNATLNPPPTEEQSDTARYVQLSQAPVHMPSGNVNYTQAGNAYHQEASAPIESMSSVEPQYYQQQHLEHVQSANAYMQSYMDSPSVSKPFQSEVYQPSSDQTYYPQHQAYELQQALEASYESGDAQLQATYEELRSLQAQYADLQKSYSEMQAYYESREKELLSQKEHFEHRASNLSDQLVRAEYRIEEAFKESVELENEAYIAKEKVQDLEMIVKQLEDAKAKIGHNEEELLHVRKQMETMDNDYNHLKDTNKRLENFLTEARTSLSEAESTRNSLGAENRHLRETLERLQKALDDTKNEQRIETEEQFLAGKAYEETTRELERENAQLRAQLSAALDNVNDNTEDVVNSTLRVLENNFDDSRPQCHEAETQCHLADEEAFERAIDPSAEDPQLTNMLKDYVKETNKFTDFLSQDVESLYVLNEELANAADSLRGQVWALNQQLKKSMLDRQEILEQIERLETENLAANNENQRLRQELDEQQNKLAAIQDQSDKWKSELSVLYDRKAEVDAAYTQLADNYSQLQGAYSSVLQKLSIPKIDGSTDPMVESSLIDSAATIRSEYAKLEKVSTQMRAELEARSEKIRNLEQQITLEVGKPLSVETSSFHAEEQARGEKATAHWTMLEIKKLLIEAADTLQKLPIDEAYEHVRRETEVQCAERVHKAIAFCENVIADIEQCDDEGTESTTTFDLPEGSDNVGIESVILRLHQRWRLKHHQLLESSDNLQSQKQICRELESRLSDAQEKLAELVSQRSSQSEPASPTSASTPSNQQPMSPSMVEFWNKLIESFSQSCRATASVDMRLSSTNNLIQNALKQLDSSSTDAQKSMISAKLQFAILAARLTAKQADNDALFRATAELANTNVALQNELDDLQEKLEAKTEVHVPEEPQKAAEETHTATVEATFKKGRQGAKTRGVISSKSKVHEKTEATVKLPKEAKQKPSSTKETTAVHQDDSWSWDTVNKTGEHAASTEVSHTNDNWSWDEQSREAVDEPTIERPRSPTPAQTPAVEIPQETTQADDWGAWGDDEPTLEQPPTPIVEKPKAKSSKPKTIKKPTPKIREPTPPVEETWGSWDESPAASSSQKEASKQETADANPGDWDWNEEAAIDMLPKRSPSRASSTASKTSKVSAKKAMTLKPAPPTSTTDDWGAWGDEVAEEEAPIKPSKVLPKKKTTAKPKTDDWGAWGDEKEEASDDWGW